MAVQRDEVQRDLWTRTAVVAGRLNRAHADLVDLAVQLVEGGHWGDGGFRSPEHYFVVRAGLSPAHARDVVAVARRRTELPVVAESVAAGQLSLDQAAVVAHHVPATHQRSVGELAAHLTVPQLRRAVSSHAFNDPGAAATADPGARPAELDQPPVAEQRACAKPELSMHYDRDGRFQLRYSPPAPIGALVEHALKEAKDALFTAQADGPDASDRAGSSGGATGQGLSDGSGDRPTYADALAEIAHRALSTVTSTSRSSHYRVYLHLSTDGGATDDDNQVSLCPFHHDAIDRGDYRIDGDPTRPDGLHITNRYGLRVRPPTAAELAPSPPGETLPRPRHHGEQPAYQPPTGERARWADIEVPPDRDLPDLPNHDLGRDAPLRLLCRVDPPDGGDPGPSSPVEPGAGLVYDSYRLGMAR